MKNLSFTVQNAVYNWSGNCSINFKVDYNVEENISTITFDPSSFTYFGRATYGSSAKASITVQAADNPDSTGSTTLTTSGSTNGGSKTFLAVPVPKSVTVRHGDFDGAKCVTISAEATVSAVMVTTHTAAHTGTGVGSVTVQSGSRESSHAVLRINGLVHKAAPYIGRKKATTYCGRIKI